ncbi:SPOC like C-terminal domain-containing protein [Cunninghamella echinulata]|nr:SPOC like C-terminal domain-containing protein [Cunninghamella echinulata]
MSNIDSFNSYFFVEEDDQAVLDNNFDSRDTILFVLDCSEKMKSLDDAGNIPVKVAFQCVQSVLLNRIFNSASDLVGVLLYGTMNKKNTSNFDHIYALHDLDIPDIDRIREAESLCSDETYFEKEYGSTHNEIPLANVFAVCSDMFAHSKVKGTKRIFLITNQDNPHSDNNSLQQAALQRAKDLLNLNIHIELFGLDRLDHVFNNKYFYQDILLSDSESQLNSSFTSVATDNKIDALLTRIRRKENKKRSQFSIPFMITPNLTIGIQGYKLTLEQKRGTYKKVTTSGSKIQEVESITAYKCLDTGEYLTEADLKYCYEFGGEKVVFSKEELTSMKDFGPSRLVLFGFKPSSTLQPYYNIKPSTFIYPTETDYDGSTRTFAALLDAVFEQDKIAICGLFRNASLPRIMALIPQKESLGDDGTQLTPPGFQMVALPYADDIRSMPIESTPQATDYQVDFMKKMMNKLFIQGKYDPQAFENPSLQRHYATLQAIALDEPIEETIDKTIPQFENIDQQLGDDIEMFRNLLPIDELSKMSLKRENEDIGDSRSSKRKATQLSVEEAWQDQQLDKCTITVLKQWLGSKAITPKGNKPQLIQQVTEIMERNQL